MLLFFSLLGCGEPIQDDVSAQVEPSSNSQVVVNLRAPTRPDGAMPLTISDRTKEELSHLLIDLEELDEGALMRALQLLNTTTGPCQPCMAEGISTADCILGADAALCENIPDYAAYIIGVAKNTERLDTARLEVMFIEPWQAVSSSDNASTETVQVSVGVDLVDPFTPGILDVVSQLEAEFGGQIEVVYRHTPLSRHPQAQAAARLSLSGISVERVAQAYVEGNEEQLAILRQEEGVELRYNSPQVESDLANSVEFMTTFGVEASPTFWVDGYRCSGAQRVEVLRTMILRAKAIRETQ